MTYNAKLERKEFEFQCDTAKPLAWPTAKIKSGQWKGRYEHASVEFMWRGWKARAKCNNP